MHPLVALLVSAPLLAVAPAARPAAPRAQDQDGALRAEVARLEGELRLLRGEVRDRDALLGEVRVSLDATRDELRALRERPQPVAAPFLAAPPTGSDRLGVAKVAVMAPRIEVESFLRHDTVSLRIRRIEPSSAQTVAELELTPDLAGIDLPIDQSGALYVVEWSTTDGHVFNLLLKDGASGQPAASVPVREKQSEGRFVLVGYRVE